MTAKQGASLHSPSIYILFFSTLVVGMGQTVVFAIIPMLGKELFDGVDLSFHLLGQKISPPQEMSINLIVAVGALTYFLVTPFWGRRSSEYGRKKIILIGLAGYTVGTFVFIVLADLGLRGVLLGWPLLFTLVFARLAHALIMSASFPASSAYIADITTVETRTKGISKLAVANQLGTLFGPALAGVAALSFLAPLAVHGVLTAIAFILVWRYLPDTEIHSAAGASVKKLGYLDPRYRFFLLIGLSMFTMMAMCQQTLGYYFYDKLGLTRVESAQYYAYAMMVSSAVMLVTQLLIVQRAGLQPHTLIKLGLPASMIGYGLLASADSFTTLAMGMACFGMGMGLAGPGYSASATLTISREEQGALAGLLAAAPGLGFVFGAVFGGLLYGIGPQYPYIVASAVTGLLVIVAYTRMQGPKIEQ